MTSVRPGESKVKLVLMLVLVLVLVLVLDLLDLLFSPLNRRAQYYYVSQRLVGRVRNEIYRHGTAYSMAYELAQAQAQNRTAWQSMGRGRLLVPTLPIQAVA
jgi:hypothetical protein